SVSVIDGSAGVVLRLALGIALAGCNSLLDNGDFRGPSAPDPARCTSRGLPPTTLTGTVFAPNGTLPIYNAQVYAPTAALADIPDGASGPICASGSPVALTSSDSHGNFTLEGVPSGANVPIVIQVGKWRRAITVASVPECTVTALDPGTTRLPRDHGEGHIPHLAIGTGRGDNVECIARDIGVADSEITTGPTSSGRVRLYNVNGASTLAADGSAIEPASALLTPAMLPQYDAVMLGCPSNTTASPATPDSAKALLDYANQGGWVWLSHHGFDWLAMAPAPWTGIATFNPATLNIPATTLLIDQGSPHGQAFAEWALATGASVALAQIAFRGGMVTGFCQAADPAITQRLLTLNPSSGIDVEMFTWDAALGGRLVFSDLHRTVSLPTGGDFLDAVYPTDCTALAPQDAAIQFELFDAPACMR
ncbi:MAG TPA: hypothetical protein VHW23_38295, partial [Kofleriaceae bacterium]|nr:hypothetical protein [Kofleriaceae bacterium]